MFTSRIVPLLVTLGLALCTAHGGRELFTGEVIALDGSGLRESESSSSFLGLVENVIKAESKFSKFENRPAIARITYAGIEDAIVVRQNRDGTRATLRIPITGLEENFTGDDREDLEEQIVDYLKENGEGEYKKFIEEVNRRSKVSPLDGNPNSATARLAANTFGDFGFSTPETVDGNASGASILGEVGRFAADEFDGESYALPIGFTFRVSERVSIVVNIPLSYIVLEGTEVYNAALSLSAPVRILQARVAESASEDGKTAGQPAQRWTWQVTPTVGGVASGSIDFALGGLIGQVALTNMLAYQFDRFTLTMGNHISWLEGLPFEVSGYDVGAGISQLLIKNGLQLSVPLGERWIATGYGIYTHFLDDAAVETYATFGAEIGYKIVPTSPTYLKLGFHSDLGSDYKSGTIRFGTGWKF